MGRGGARLPEHMKRARLRASSICAGWARAGLSPYWRNAVFFDRFGQNASSGHSDPSSPKVAAAPGRKHRHSKTPQESSRVARRRALAIGLAVNVALPMGLRSRLSGASLRTLERASLETTLQ